MIVQGSPGGAQEAQKEKRKRCSRIPLKLLLNASGKSITTTQRRRQDKLQDVDASSLLVSILIIALFKDAPQHRVLAVRLRTGPVATNGFAGTAGVPRMHRF